MHKIKKWHFASFLGRPLNEVHVKCVCKLCIHKHSDKPVLDHNQNLQKCNLRKYIPSSPTPLNTFLQIWNSSEAFESNYWRKCLWDGCSHGLFLSINSKLRILLFTFKLLFLSVVFHCCKCKGTVPKAVRLMTKLNSSHLLFVYTRQFTLRIFYYRGILPFKFSVPCVVVKKLEAKISDLKLLFVFGR